MADRNPSFGLRDYWHLVDGAPLADVHQSAEVLLTIVRAHDDQPSAKWPIAPCVIRAMALELVMACSLNGRLVPESVLQLAAWAMDVPQIAMADPAAFYAGGWKGGSALKELDAKARAAWLDREHFQATGEFATVSGLKAKLAEVLGDDAAPARSTLRRWRQETDYDAFVRLFVEDQDMVATPR